MLFCCTKREEAANGKPDNKAKAKGKAEKKDDDGSDKEVVKEWRTRSRGLEKGAIILPI